MKDWGIRWGRELLTRSGCTSAPHFLRAQAQQEENESRRKKEGEEKRKGIGKKAG